jgi:predicted metal-dependent hydrolase
VNIERFNSDSTLPYLGKNYPLKIQNKIRGKFEFSSRTDNWSESQIKESYEGWLYQRAEKLFSKKVKEYSRVLKVDIHKKGVVNLNLHLLKAPDKIIDYIIIHELCHVLIKGHSYRFWNLVRQIIPDYGKSIMWLEKNATSLIE